MAPGAMLPDLLAPAGLPGRTSKANTDRVGEAKSCWAMSSPVKENLHEVTIKEYDQGRAYRRQRGWIKARRS
eukprot:scaffold4477_cov21-Tisochrysis_lutea.AAC.1